MSGKYKSQVWDTNNAKVNCCLNTKCKKEKQVFKDKVNHIENINIGET